MSTFMMVAFVMVAVACAVLITPLIRRGRVTDQAPAPEPVATVPVVAVLIALPLLALGLYGRVSDGVPDTAAMTAPSNPGAGGVPSVPDMVAALEQRLADQPDDQQGWQMLGRSYVVMGRYADGTRAYDQALALAADREPGLVLDYAEAMILGNPDSIKGAAAELVEEALGRSPANRKGLWYGGTAAFERGDFALARDRWQRLAADSPPEALVALLNERIAAAAQLGEPPVTAATAQGVASGEDAGQRVEVTVSLAPELAQGVTPDQSLFVLARSPGGGPPLAVVRRQVRDLPLAVTLSDADAMLPGRTISSQPSVEIVARIALGGSPVAASGDLFGSVNYNTSDAGGVRILIDRVQP